MKEGQEKEKRCRQKRNCGNQGMNNRAREGYHLSIFTNRPAPRVPPVPVSAPRLKARTGTCTAHSHIEQTLAHSPLLSTHNSSRGSPTPPHKVTASDSKTFQHWKEYSTFPPTLRTPHQGQVNRASIIRCRLYPETIDFHRLTV